MKTEIIAKLKTELDNMSESDLLDICKRRGISLDEAIGVENIKYVRIKLPAEITGLDRDTDRHHYEARTVKTMRENTRSIKVYWDGTFYFNQTLGVRLRPEWVEIIITTGTEIPVT